MIHIKDKHCFICQKPASKWNMGVVSSLLNKDSPTKPLWIANYCSFSHNFGGSRYVNTFVIFYLIALNYVIPWLGLPILTDTIHPLIKWFGVWLQIAIAVASFWVYHKITKQEQGSLRPVQQVNTV